MARSVESSVLEVVELEPVRPAPLAAPLHRSARSPALPTNPPLHRDARNVRYQFLRGRGCGASHPAVSAVRQGQARNSTLAAALQAIAFQRPDLIRDLVGESQDGTVTVAFRNVDGEGAVGIHPVTVTQDLPVDPQGSLIYNDPGLGGPLWACWVEKAYARMRGGYDAIADTAEGNSPDAILRALTGGPVSRIVTASLNPDELFRRLRERLFRKAPVLAVAPQACQAFAVIGTIEECDDRLILLRSPSRLGNEHAIPVEVFVREIATVYWVTARR